MRPFAIPMRRFRLLPHVSRAPFGWGWYVRWGRTLRLYKTIMGARP